MTKVLIVEDEAVLSTLLSAQLERLEYQVSGVARSGEQAIELAQSTLPDLILMDIMMPGKLNGIQAAEVITSNLNIPVIFLTARSDEEAINEAKKVTPYGYLIKPVKIFDIKAAIEIALSRIELERELHRSEARYRAVVEDQAEVICRFLPDKTLTFANSAFCRQFAMNNKAVIGAPFTLASPDEDLPKDINQPVSTRERSLNLPDGSVHWYQWTDRAIFNEFNELVEYQSVGTDITDIKLAEEELTEHRNHLQELVDEKTADLRVAKEDAEEANRSKSEFLANMSHELRTPMHGILSFAQLGITKIDQIDKQRLFSYFQKIEISGNRLLSLLNNLLDLSQMEAGKTAYHFTNNNLLLITHLVVASFKEQLEEKNQSIEVIEPEFNLKLTCDSFRIEQLINNLISNAIKFSSDGKKTTIWFGLDQLEQDGNSVPALNMTVRDEGVGIPESELNTVFEKFIQSSRTKTGAGGKGLGLAICNEIVKAHQGSIKAENHPDGGAVFAIVLPVKIAIL